MTAEKFENLLKVLELYKLKQIPRDSTNAYDDEKDGVSYERRETTAEHVYSTLRLADFFLCTEEEFKDLDRLHIYELIMYHDDIEALTGDIGIGDREKRKDKGQNEINAVPTFAKKLPRLIDEKFLTLDAEYRAQKTPEAKFAKAMDKIDALVHEFQYPLDWVPKGYDEENVRSWFRGPLEYSPTLVVYFEKIMEYLVTHGYFDK